MLHDHLEKHSKSLPVKCQQCNKNFTNENELAKHGTEHNSNSFVCESSHNNFKSSQDLQKHLNEHSRSSAIQCKKCDEIFVNEEESKRHRGNNCSNNMFKCNECDSIFEENESLSKHMMSQKQVEEFRCCKCDKAYPDMSKLRQVHKMVKKIKCKFFPDYLDGDECFFVHDDISSLENEKNRYCLEGEKCLDQSCEFPEREHKNGSNTFCRYQSKCKKPVCRFKHVVEKASFLEDCTQNCRKK